MTKPVKSLVQLQNLTFTILTLCIETKININQIFIHCTTGAYFSKKSIPSSCISPRVQNRALNFLISPSGYRLHLIQHSVGIVFFNTPYIQNIQSSNFNLNGLPVLIGELASSSYTSKLDCLPHSQLNVPSKREDAHSSR